MSTASPSPPRPFWRDVALIVVLSAILTVPSMFTRDLWNPDEPRYTEVAREMVVLHDYLIPHLNGKVYAEKPPVFFWLTALLWKAGLGLVSARVLVALASLGTLLATYFFSRRFLKGDGPLLAALATLSLLFFVFVDGATSAVINPLEMLLVGSATLCGYLALQRRTRRPGLWWLAAYGLAGLATLTKGPVGFLLPGVALAAYGLLDRKRVRAGGKVHALGALLFVAIVLAWLVPAIASGGRAYAQTILVDQNLGRVVQSSSHANPFYYYIMKAPVLLLPWTPLLVLAIYSAVKLRREEGGGLPLFAATWMGATVAFLSCISGKRTGYILPMVPAVGLLVGWHLTGAVSGRRLQWPRADLWLLRASLALVGLAAAAFLVLTFFRHGFAVLFQLEAATASGAEDVLDARWHVTAVALLLPPAACALAGWFCAREHLTRASVLLALAVVLCAVWFDQAVTPAKNRAQSPRGFCDGALRYVKAEDALWFYDIGFSGTVTLYMNRGPIPVIDTPDGLRAALRAPGTWVISDVPRCEKVLTRAELVRYTVTKHILGDREMVLLRGEAPPTAPGRAPGMDADQ